jgi:NTP pyrophosphatase (non-canonical NTP hydrolase)
MSHVLERYTRQVRSNLFLKPEHEPRVHCALGLAGESGEVADLFKKAQYCGRPAIDEGKLVEELGDVFWYHTWLLSDLGLTHEELAWLNVCKLEDRHGVLSTYDRKQLIFG